VTEPTSAGVYTNSQRDVWGGPEDVDAYTIEVEFELVSGSLTGAKILFDYRNTAVATFRQSIPLEDMISETPVVGKRYTGSYVIHKPDNFVGTFDYNAMYIMANYSDYSGPRAAKHLKIHRFQLHPTSQDVHDAATSAAAAVISASSASASQGFAFDYKDAASTSAGEALGYKNQASGFKDEASGFKDEASGFKDDASGFKDDAYTYSEAASEDAVAASGSAGAASTSEINAAASLVLADEAYLGAVSAKEVAAKLFSRGVSPNPVFSDWDGAKPHGVAIGIGTNGATYSKNIVAGKYENCIQLLTETNPTSAHPWADCWSKNAPDDYQVYDATDVEEIVVDLEIEIFSGQWGGAKIYAEWRAEGTGGTTAATSFLFEDYLPVSIGTVQTVEFYAKKPAGYVAGSSPGTIRILVYGTTNSGTGYQTNKLRIHSLDYRVLDGGSLSSITQSAIADLDGNLQAAITLRATAGGGGALLELVAADDAVNGVKSTARIAADDIILDGSVLIGHVDQTFAANELENSNFRQGAHGVFMSGTQDLMAETEFAVRAPGLTYAGLQFPTIMMKQVGSGTLGYSDFWFAPADASGVSYMGYPVTPGQTYEFSMFYALLRAKMLYTLIQWRTAAGDHISYDGWGGPSVDSGTGIIGSSTDPETWPQTSRWGTAPSNAAFARILVRKTVANPASTTSSYVFGYKPMFSRCSPNAASLNPWTPSGNTFIDGPNIFTNSITADRLNVTSLDAISGTIGHFKSATSGERVEIKDDLIQIFDSTGQVRVKIGDLS